MKLQVFHLQWDMYEIKLNEYMHTIKLLLNNSSNNTK